MAGGMVLNQARREADARPAVVADGAIKRRDESFAASRARRLEEGGEKAVGEAAAGFKRV
ncbi:MAG TPA: hypothetical protein VF491_15980 [Vicinamibacterales bacterium]